MLLLAFLLADSAPTPQDNVPTALVALITALALPLATVFVAFISRRGERRTHKSDSVPDVIEVLEHRLIDLQDRLDAVIRDRDIWRDMATRQMQASELDTTDALNSPGTHARP